MKLEYKLVEIRSFQRHPGYIYASIVDEHGGLVVNATLDYCVRWLERAAQEAIKAEKSNSNKPA